MSARKINLVANGKSLIGLRGIFADNELVQTRLKHPALNNFHELADLQNIRRDATNLNVCIRARADERNWNYAHYILCEQWGSRGVACDPRRILQNLD